ncbi:hypothetical protein VCR4J2_280035 [Vibrio coralliirubri]|nr:hypothetical protein VCR9J2_150059 [Vibrio crassostreae]CDT23434.1 hypothetical protein VCR4J2_280035 [Vibrio coralliirubri]
MHQYILSSKKNLMILTETQVVRVNMALLPKSVEPFRSSAI